MDGEDIELKVRECTKCGTKHAHEELHVFATMPLDYLEELGWENPDEVCQAYQTGIPIELCEECKDEVVAFIRASKKH